MNDLIIATICFVAALPVSFVLVNAFNWLFFFGEN